MKVTFGAFLGDQGDPPIFLENALVGLILGALLPIRFGTSKENHPQTCRGWGLGRLRAWDLWDEALRMQVLTLRESGA